MTLLYENSIMHFVALCILLSQMFKYWHLCWIFFVPLQGSSLSVLLYALRPFALRQPEAPANERRPAVGGWGVGEPPLPDVF